MARIPDDKKTAALLKETDWLRRLARGLVRSEADAEDLVQATVFEALKRDGAGGEESRPFLATLMRRLSLKKLRSDERRQRREETHALLRSTRDPMTSIERVEAQERLIAALRRLPDLELQVLVLRYFDDLPPRRIAQDLELPLETVKSRLKRGLQKLKADLGREQNGDFRLALLPILAADLGKKSALVSSTSLIWKGAALMSTSTKIGISAAALILVATSFYFFDDFVSESSSLNSEAVVAAPDSLELRSVARSDGSEILLKEVATERLESSEVPREVQRAQPELVSIVIGGRVLDEHGTPVADALVRWARSGDDVHHDFGSAISDLVACLSAQPVHEAEPLPNCRSDREGRYRMERSFTRDTLPKAVTMEAAHPEIGMGQRRSVPVPEEGSLDLDIPLKAGVLLSGQIVDEAGVPLAGAEIQYTGVGDGGFQSTRSIFADAEGRYAFPALPVTRMFLYASAAGYCTSSRVTENPISTPTLIANFKLRRQAQSEARLLLADGSELQLPSLLREKFGVGAAAAWRQENRTRVCLSWNSPEDDIVSDMVDERFIEFEEAKSRYTLKDDHPGKIVYFLVGTTILGRARVGEDGLAPDIIIDPGLLPPLKERASLVVHVKDEEGLSLSDFSVEYGLLRDKDDFLAEHATREVAAVRGQGKRIDRLESGLWLITVHAKGYVSASSQITLAGEERELTFKLVHGTCSFAGRIVDDSGLAVAGCQIRVVAFDDRGRASVPLARATSNEAGEFSMEGLPEGRALAFVSAPDFAVDRREIMLGTEELKFVVSMQKGLAITFEIKSSAACTFTILDASGLPIHDDRITGSSSLGGRSIALPPGHFRAEVRSPGHEVWETEFDARDGLELPVRFQD